MDTKYEVYIRTDNGSPLGSTDWRTCKTLIDTLQSELFACGIDPVDVDFTRTMTPGGFIVTCRHVDAQQVVNRGGLEGFALAVKVAAWRAVWPLLGFVALTVYVDERRSQHISANRDDYDDFMLLLAQADPHTRSTT